MTHTQSSRRNGDICEQELQLYFLKEGWEVFTNIGGDGPIDMVIVNKHTGETRLIDCKKITKQSKSTDVLSMTSTKTPIQEELGVEILGLYEGTLYSDESIKDTRIGHPSVAKKVYAEGSIYDNLEEAAKALSINPNTLNSRCHNKNFMEFYKLD